MDEIDKATIQAWSSQQKKCKLIFRLAVFKKQLVDELKKHEDKEKKTETTCVSCMLNAHWFYITYWACCGTLQYNEFFPIDANEPSQEKDLSQSQGKKDLSQNKQEKKCQCKNPITLADVARLKLLTWRLYNDLICQKCWQSQDTDSADDTEIEEADD